MKAMTPIRILLGLVLSGAMTSVFAGATGAAAEFAFADALATQTPALDLPAGDCWTFDALITPGRFDRNGAAGITFAGADGSHWSVVLRPHHGGVLLDPEGLPAGGELWRNPTMNLAEGDTAYRLPVRIRVRADAEGAQLYLGFDDLPAEAIHAAYFGRLPRVTGVSVFARGAEAGFSDLQFTASPEPPPDLSARPPVRDAMPTWSEFVGTHYIAREPFLLYRGLFYDPIVYRCEDTASATPNYRPWVGLVAPDRLPKSCVRRPGPFSGKTIWVDVERARQIVDWAEAHHARLVHGRDIMKRTEYGTPDEAALRKDELYWSVRALYEGRAPESVPIVLQLGNEVNGFHVPWKNHPDVARRYVEYDFAPAAEAIRRVSEDLYGSPDRIPFLIGSVSSPWPVAYGWLITTANTRIAGDWAPSLRGRTVVELAHGASIHYTMKGPFWSQTLDAIYGRLVASGKVFALWSTEEVGGNADVDRGPYVAAIPFRYLDWWSRHDWQPGRGAVLFWGDTRGREHATTALDVQRLLGSFFGSRRLRNLTDQVTSTGDADREVYAFSAAGEEGPRVGFAVLSHQYWFYPKNPATGIMRLDTLRIPGPEAAGRRVRVAWYRVTDERIVPAGHTEVAVDASGEVALTPRVTLDRSREEILLGFVAPASGAADAAFSYEPPAQESTRLDGAAEIESFHLGNDLAVDLGSDAVWSMLSDGGNVGRTFAGGARRNPDDGMAGDHHGLTADRRNDQAVAYTLNLQRAAEAGRGVRLVFTLIGDPVEVRWDGEVIAGAVTAAEPVVEISAAVAARLFQAGPHALRLQNAPGKSTSVDAMIITPN